MTESAMERFTGTALPMPSDLPEPLVIEPRLGGLHVIWRFANGRGASVINHSGSYGTELAVLRFMGESVADFELDYSTPVTGDVIGHIESPNELFELLRRIRDLPSAGNEPTGNSDGSGQDFADALSSLTEMLGHPDS